MNRHLKLRAGVLALLATANVVLWICVAARKEISFERTTLGEVAPQSQLSQSERTSAKPAHPIAVHPRMQTGGKYYRLPASFIPMFRHTSLFSEFDLKLEHDFSQFFPVDENKRQQTEDLVKASYQKYMELEMAHATLVTEPNGDQCARISSMKGSGEALKKHLEADLRLHYPVGTAAAIVEGVASAFHGFGAREYEIAIEVPDANDSSAPGKGMVLLQERTKENDDSPVISGRGQSIDVERVRKRFGGLFDSIQKGQR